MHLPLPRNFAGFEIHGIDHGPVLVTRLFAVAAEVESLLGRLLFGLADGRGEENQISRHHR